MLITQVVILGKTTTLFLYSHEKHLLQTKMKQKKRTHFTKPLKTVLLGIKDVKKNKLNL
jgi:hypothetical protein